MYIFLDESGQLGEAIFNLLKNNIIGEGKEMFKDYWQNKYNKKPNRLD